MTISDNQVVSIIYNVKDRDGGDLIDSNEGREPLEFIVGKGQVIIGLESALKGMKMGESKEVEIAPVDAYGEYNTEAKQTLPKEQFAGIDLKIGMSLYGRGEDGATVEVVVKDISDDSVTIDFNHPLAGKTLLFSVSVVGVRDATIDEVLSGQVGGGKSSGCCGSGGGGCGCH